MGTPWMGCNIQEIEELDRILLIGSNIRNEHPLLAQRFRKAVNKGAELSIVSPLDNNPLMDVAHKVIVRPNDMVNVLGQILKAMSGLQRLSLCLPPSLNKLLEDIKVRPNTEAIARSLAGLGDTVDLVAPKVGIFLGSMALSDPRYTEMYTMVEAIGGITGAKGGLLPSAANSTGMHLIGATPGTKGLNARAMLESPRKAYLLVIAPFTETSGTFMSMEGRVQSFQAATKPLGEARPGWKVLRVLANTLGLPGFDFENSEQVKNAAFGGQKPSTVVWNSLNNNLKELVEIQINIKHDGLQRIGEVPQYESDPIVRRSPPLQKTKYNIKPMARMCASEMAALGLAEGDQVLVKQDKGSAILTVKLDNHVAMGCVRVAASHPDTVSLGDLMGEITVEKFDAPVAKAADKVEAQV